MEKAMSSDQDSTVIVDEQLVQAIFTASASRQIGSGNSLAPFEAIADDAYQAARAYAVSLARRRENAHDAWL